MTRPMETTIIRHALRLLAQQSPEHLTRLEPWLTQEMVESLAEHYPLPDPQLEEAKRLIMQHADLIKKGAL